MATRFVPTHVRSAIALVETDHERTTTERDAFESFLHRISDLDVSSVDLQPNHAHQASTQTLTTPETPEHAESQLERVRSAYRETIMSVPHYDEDYGDSLPKSLAEEFDPKIATAILISDQLTLHLRNRLIDATHHARESRHAPCRASTTNTPLSRPPMRTSLVSVLTSVISSPPSHSMPGPIKTSRTYEILSTHASRNVTSSLPIDKPPFENSAFRALITSITNSHSTSTRRSQSPIPS